MRVSCSLKLLPTVLPIGALAKRFPGICIDQATSELVWENKQITPDLVPAPRTVSDVVADRLRQLLALTDMLPDTHNALSAITKLEERDNTLYEPDAVKYRAYQRDLKRENDAFLEQVGEVLEDEDAKSSTT